MIESKIASGERIPNKSSLDICISLHTLQAGGGVQERRVMLANDWIEKGHKVTIVVPTRPKNIISNLDKNINVLYLSKRPDKERFHVLSIPSLCKFFSNKKFDAVFAATPQQIFITAIALSISRNDSPLIASVHGALKIGGGFKEKIIELSYWVYLKLAMYRINKLFGVSHGVAKDVKRVLKINEVEVIPNPVVQGQTNFVLKKAELRNSLFDEDWEMVVIGVGRLNRQKGFDLLIKAFALIDLNVHLVIVGEGEEKERLESLVDRLGLKRRVHFLGYKKNAVDYIAASDCFVLSSRYEGFGNVLVEALYAQTPIVSFDCEHGPSDILENEKYGYLVECFDINSLSSHISLSLKEKKVYPNTRWLDYRVDLISERYLSLI